VANSIKNESAYGEIFNIGATKIYTVNEVASLVQAAFGQEEAVINMPERNEIKRVYCSTNKSRLFFGNYPETSLFEAITNMVEWAKKRGVNEPKYFEDIEVYKNLPKSWLKN
jgi:nucleoside-diphosphate-sugar epimerase